MAKPTIIITCTAPRCDEIIARLKQQGYDAQAMPALEVRPLSSLSLPTGDFDAVLITSRHAIINQLPRDLPYIAVGKTTADLLRETGYNVVSTGNSGIDDLDLSGYPSVLYPAALEPTACPANVVHWPVYETIYTKDFSLPPRPCLIAVYSKKAAEQIISKTRQEDRIFCLSDAIAKRFSDHPAQNLVVCSKPLYAIMEKNLCAYARQDENT